jgi:protein-tyrosine phosphatase
MTELLHNPEGALAYMEQVYTTFVTNDFAISQYAHFLDLLLQERKGAVLWHCTAGKDRAGFASILVQHLLGVSREDILEDYMMTNQCLVPEVEPLIAMIQKQVHDDSPQVRQVLEILFGARKEYLAALYEKIQERFGSFEAFVEQALGIDQEKRARLQEMYLEG